MLDHRLKNQLVADTAKVFHEEIVARLAQGDTPAAKAAWELLSALLSVDQVFAANVIIENWPADPKRALSLLSVTPDWTDELICRIRLAQEDAGPLASHRFINSQNWDEDLEEHHSERVERRLRFSVLPQGMLGAEITKKARLILRSGNNRISYSHFISMDPSQSFVIGSELQSRANWGSHEAISLFMRDPSASSLAAMIREIEMRGRDGLMSRDLPWVCGSILKELEDGVSHETLAREVEDGKFGDFKVWTAAEHRWRNDGVDFIEFDHGCRCH
jgi:hypothetical protein